MGAFVVGLVEEESGYLTKRPIVALILKDHAIVQLRTRFSKAKYELRPVVGDKLA